MRSLLSVSAFLFIVCLCTVQGGLSSCSKDKTIYDTVTVIDKDTVIVKDTVLVDDVMTKEQILASNTWQVDELWRSIIGINSHYLRGGENTTGVNYSLLRLTFNEDGTGTYVDEVGTSHTATWHFTTDDKHNMEIAVGPPFAQTFVWTLIEINKESITCTSTGGSSSMLTARYIPVP